MHTIENYLETMFINLPQTPELLQLKEDILANMEDKYNELIEEGVSENAAIGQVISEFGNIDEILSEWNVSQDESVNNETEELLREVSIQEVDGIIQVKKSMALKVGLGVVACCVALSSLLFFLAQNNELLGIIGMLFFAAVGVGLFILGGFQNTKLEWLQDSFVLTGNTKKEVERQKEEYQKSFVVSVTLGVVLCIFSVMPVIFCAIVDENNESFMLRAISVMFLIAAIGVFLFIYAGNVIGTYDLLLKNSVRKQPTKESLDKINFKKKIDSIYWPIVTVIFFVWMFVFDGYAIAWVIFPIAGVLSNIWDN